MKLFHNFFNGNFPKGHSMDLALTVGLVQWTHLKDKLMESGIGYCIILNSWVASRAHRVCPKCRVYPKNWEISDMSLNTESRRVGYRKKCRVAGGYWVPFWPWLQQAMCSEQKSHVRNRMFNNKWPKVKVCKPRMNLCHHRFFWIHLNWPILSVLWTCLLWWRV